MTSLDELLDDLFHGAAIAAFVEEAGIAQSFPCPEKTKQRAYRYYEHGLAERNSQKSDDTKSATPAQHPETSV